MTTTWAGRAIDTVTASDIQAMRQQITDHARARRNSRGGRHAGGLFVAAARAAVMPNAARSAARTPKPVKRTTGGLVRLG